MPTGQAIGPDGHLTLEGSEAHHLTHVLRLAPGEEVELVDGAGWSATARIVSARGQRVDLAFTGRGCASDDALPIHLLVAILKRERMDWLIEKAAELGVASIRPVVTTRTVVRPALGRRPARRDRWQEVARQALKQCRGSTTPQVAQIASLEEALSAVEAFPGRILLWEDEFSRAVIAAWQLQGLASPLAVLVGPEGGFTEEEVGRCREAGFLTATLGSRTLRAETAALAAIAILGAAMTERREATSP